MQSELEKKSTEEERKKAEQEHAQATSDLEQEVNYLFHIELP